MEKREIRIELDLDVKNFVYLTYEQLIEKHANLAHVFYEEDLLIWLYDWKFIHCLSRHPREVKEGKNYEFEDKDMDLPVEEYIRFYDERSIFDFLEFANKRWQAVNELISDRLNKNKPT